MVTYLGLNNEQATTIINQIGQVQDKSLNFKTNELSQKKSISILTCTLYEKLVAEILEKINEMVSDKKNTHCNLILVDGPSPQSEEMNHFDALNINYLNERFIYNFTENLSISEKVDLLDRI